MQRDEKAIRDLEVTLERLENQMSELRDSGRFDEIAKCAQKIRTFDRLLKEARWGIPAH
mgnify:CR=1 FL=1